MVALRTSDGLDVARVEREHGKAAAESIRGAVTEAVDIIDASCVWLRKRDSEVARREPAAA